MLLDKFLAYTGRLTLSTASKAVRGGQVTVNGERIRTPDLHIDPETDEISLGGEVLTYRRYTYILLNKPDGYVSATEDGNDPTVLTLLPEELQRQNLFPCGRLDKHTLGLMLLTNHGPLAHRLLAPRTHVEKTYVFTLREPISPEETARLERGVRLLDGAGESYLSRPCRITMDAEGKSGSIVLTEGKYHEIKRLFEAANNKVLTLERTRFDTLTLDGLPERGQWRHLTPEEEKSLLAHLHPSQSQSE
ncbi:MAG: rRNA pseudouridine synthase [Clostridia bacterium]|nr:rRNA pseudouridine synthase [Clostridia bacterium]